MDIVPYKKHYNVFLKWLDESMKVSWEWWEILMRILEDKDCPPFVKINSNLYNRFEILRVELHEETMSPERASALAEHNAMIAYNQANQWNNSK